jgi:hypothetical protein
MTTMTFDKLAYIDRLKAAGFAEPQARAMADGLDQALREEVATKSDLAALRAEFKSELGLLRSDLGLLRGDMGGLKGELLAAMKADKVDLLKWVVMLIVGQTAVFTTLKLSRSLARQSCLPSYCARCEWLTLSPIWTELLSASAANSNRCATSAFCDLSILEVIPFGF